MKIQTTTKEIPQTPIENAFTTYWFVHNDYREGLNYPVGKELINRGLAAVGEILGETLEEMEDSLLAEKYLEMMRPLLSRVRTALREEEEELQRLLQI